MLVRLGDDLLVKTILVTNKYIGKPLEIIMASVPKDFELLMLDKVDNECLERKIGLADYLLVSGRVRISDRVLVMGKRLKMIQRTGVGLDSLDLEIIKKHSIPLYVNQGINAESVAEHTLLLILASLRRLTVINQKTKNGIWEKQGQGTETHELKGKTVGIIGMGNIARTLVDLLIPFNVKILYYDLTQMPAEYEKAHHMQYVGINELLSVSDIITLHCALTETTRGIINKQNIAKMKDEAILVNTARGALIIAEDLAEGLLSGKIAFAGIDVHEDEPIKDKYVLKNLNNVILTPHIGGITYESFRCMMQGAMRNIEKFEQGDLDEIQQYRYL